jgi:hypothetical protein
MEKGKIWKKYAEKEEVKKREKRGKEGKMRENKR